MKITNSTNTGFLTDKEAQIYLKSIGLPASRSTLYRARQDGDLKGHRTKGKKIRYTRADLEAFVRSTVVAAV